MDEELKRIRDLVYDYCMKHNSIMTIEATAEGRKLDHKVTDITVILEVKYI